MAQIRWMKTAETKENSAYTPLRIIETKKNLS